MEAMVWRPWYGGHGMEGHGVERPWYGDHDMDLYFTSGHRCCRLQKSAGWYRHHSTVKDIIHRALAAAHVSSRL